MRTIKFCVIIFKKIFRGFIPQTSNWPIDSAVRWEGKRGPGEE